MGRRSREIVPAMTDMIATVLDTGALLIGLLIITVMAALPLLERFGTPERRP